MMTLNQLLGCKNLAVKKGEEQKVLEGDAKKEEWKINNMQNQRRKKGCRTEPKKA